MVSMRQYRKKSIKLEEMLPFECVYCLYYYSLSTSNLAHEYTSKKQLFSVCVCVCTDNCSLVDR